MLPTGPLVLLISVALVACAPRATPPAADGTPAASPTEQAVAPASAGTPTEAAAAPADAPTEPAAAPTPSPAPRDPETVRREGNHLKGNRSLYLQQHAFNPLDWYPWGEEALARARAEDKPIFLSIGYSSCHWCHVMEEEVFTKDAVARYMNEHFISIKVDREERPDLDAIYMDAVQAMTGRGGWPMTVLLTPNLKPFFGGTYFPETRFMGIVTKAVERFRTDRNGVESDGARIYAQLSRVPESNGSKVPDSDTLRRMVERVVGSVDPTWGGFRGRMKFPTPVRWRFLLHAWRKWGGDELGVAVRKTLDQMAAGGIHDQVGGGFHRYTTEQTWLIPHFEKMLYDNGQLASLYFEAAAAFSEPRYVEVGRWTLDFMLKEMGDPGGGFYGSFDADSGGEEGTFYVWTPRELRALAGERDGEVLEQLLGVTQRGNFEHGTTVVTRRTSYGEVARQTRRTPEQVEAVWKTWQPKLYEVRSKRVWPGLDKKIVTAWNGLALSALAHGYRATGEARYLEAATRTAGYLWRVHRKADGSVFRVTNGGVPDHRGVLDDYAFVAVGLLDLYEATGEMVHVQRAMELAEAANARFLRPEGSWYFSEDGDASLLLRPYDPFDSVRPSGTSAMLDVELRLAALAGDSKRWERVEKTVASHASLIQRSATGMAGWADMAMRLGGPYYELVVAGDPGEATADKLLAVLSELRPTWAVEAVVPAAGADEAAVKLLPALFAKTSGDARAQAFVCVRGACERPTSDPATFRAQVMRGWQR